MLFSLLLTLAIFVEIYTYFFSVVDAIFNQRNALITGRANMGDVDNNHYIKIFFHTYHFTSLLASDVVLFCFACNVAHPQKATDIIAPTIAAESCSGHTTQPSV